jgi:hypothetical protein
MLILQRCDALLEEQRDNPNYAHNKDLCAEFFTAECNAYDGPLRLR